MKLIAICHSGLSGLPSDPPEAGIFLCLLKDSRFSTGKSAVCGQVGVTDYGEMGYTLVKE